MKVNKMKKYIGPEIIKGVNDLKSTYAFRGGSQGDESRSNDCKLFKDSNGWMILDRGFVGVDLNDQEAVNKRSEELKLENEKYIKHLKEINEYGKSDGHITIHLKENPELDMSNCKKSCISYSYEIYDFSK